MIQKQSDTKENFITKANKKHNNFWGYDKVNYIKTNTKVIITCPEHGDILQQPNNHLQGNGCPNCRKDIMGKWNLSNKEDFCVKANQKHNYLYCYDCVNYEGNHIKVDIICKMHGLFSQTPGSHLSGSGCPQCGLDIIRNSQRSSNEEFCEKANLKHNNFYDYEKVNYINSNTKIVITCRKHGDYEQTPHNHLAGNGCPMCINKTEGKLFNELIDLYPSLQTQFKVDWCITPVYKKMGH